jgi:hypothetical protein
VQASFECSIKLVLRMHDTLGVCNFVTVYENGTKKNKGCVNYTVALPFTLKSILRQKKFLIMETQIFHRAKI